MEKVCLKFIIMNLFLKYWYNKIVFVFFLKCYYVIEFYE